MRAWILVPEKDSACERCEPPLAKMSPPPATYGYIVVDSDAPQQFDSNAFFIAAQVVSMRPDTTGAGTGTVLVAGFCAGCRGTERRSETCK